MVRSAIVNDHVTEIASSSSKH